MKRKIKDKILNIITYIFSFCGIIILISILSYVFINGYKNLSFDLLTSDYEQITYNLKRDDIENYILNEYEYSCEDDEFFSPTWGIALKDSKDIANNDVIEITYIANTSPFNNMINVTDKSYFLVKKGLYIDKIILSNDTNTYYALAKDGAENMILNLNNSMTAFSFFFRADRLCTFTNPLAHTTLLFFLILWHLSAQNHRFRKLLGNNFFILPE